MFVGVVHMTTVIYISVGRVIKDYVILDLFFILQEMVNINFT